MLFSCDDVRECVLPTTGQSVGIDLGLESFLTTCHGEHVTNPRLLRDASAGVRKAWRVVSKRARGGTLRKKAVRRVAKRHRAVERMRRDFHHKTACRLVRQHNLIAVEDLIICGLSAGHAVQERVRCGMGAVPHDSHRQGCERRSDDGRGGSPWHESALLGVSAHAGDPKNAQPAPASLRRAGMKRTVTSTRHAISCDWAK